MEYLTDELALKAIDKRIPFDVSLELTRRCNQSCAMCYLPESTSVEMNTQTVRDVLTRLAKAQCLFLTFTGGELFLRDDALELIDFATDLGFAVTVKTNGTLLDAKTVQSLAASNVLEVHVSILGATAAAHDFLTGKQGSFDVLLHSIKLLKLNGITVVIMSVIQKGNINEIIPIKNLARDLGIEHVNFSAILFPRYPGDTAVLNHRLTFDELQQFYATVKTFYSTENTPSTQCIKNLDDERLLSCTAIQNGITITPDGTVIACSSIPVPLGNIVKDSIDSILFSEQADAIIKALQLSSTPGCASCNERAGCIRCPGIAYMDNLSMNTIPLEACRHTKAFKSISEYVNYKKIL